MQTSEIQDKDETGALWATEDEKREQEEQEANEEWEAWFDFVRAGQ
jgi:hypothetical protein